MELKTGYPGGVPLGGIGAGMFEILKTGRPGTITINNNWARPILDAEGCFFVVTGEWEKGERFFRLLQEESMEGHPGATSVTYTGRYPVTQVEYHLLDIPLQVKLQAFSPMVPQRLEDSCIPGAVLTFQLQNVSSQSCRVTLHVSWENLLGCGSWEEQELYTQRTGTTISWKEEAAYAGLFFETNAAADTLPPNTWGNYSWMCRCTDALSLSYSTWNVLQDRKTLLDRLAEKRKFQTQAVTGEEGICHPAGVLHIQLDIGPYQTVEVPTAFTWYTPQLKQARQAGASGGLALYAPQHQQGESNIPAHTLAADKAVDYGHYYENIYSSSWQVGMDLLQRKDDLLSATVRLHDFLQQSDVPEWLTDKILNDTVPITTNSVLLRDGTLTTLEASRGMLGALGTMDQRLVSHAAMQLLHPQTNRTEIRLFASLQGEDGHIPHFCGNVHEKIGTSFVDYGDTLWPDLSCSFIIQCYRDLLETGERSFFDEMLPYILRAYTWLTSADHDGDGVPEGGTTWDVEFYNGLFIYTGTVWLATLRVMDKVGELLGDETLRQDARKRFERARKIVVQGLWNGSYFNKVKEPGTGAVSDEIFAGQLAGEWVVRLLGLESILPEEMVRAALQTIYRTNGNRSLYKLPPNQVKREGTLVERDYSEHSWPQYYMAFVDCLALYMGMEEAAMDSLHHFDHVVCDIAKTPWSTTLWYDSRTGLPAWDKVDRYMNCPAVWFVLNALSGFHPDAWHHTITLGPAVTSSRKCRYPLLSSSYWAYMDVWSAGESQYLQITFHKIFSSITLETIKIRGNCVPQALKYNENEISFHYIRKEGYTCLEMLSTIVKEDDVLTLAYADTSYTQLWKQKDNALLK